MCSHEGLLYYQKKTKVQTTHSSIVGLSMHLYISPEYIHLPTSYKQRKTDFLMSCILKYTNLYSSIPEQL